MFGEDEVALRGRQEKDIPGLGVADQDAGYGADVGHRDGRILACRGAERVGPPVPDAVELHADACPLAGKVGASRGRAGRWMVADSAVSWTTLVTTPRSCRAEYTGLNSARMSSGAKGVVSTEAAWAS
jgi:hypothetical protein